MDAGVRATQEQLPVGQTILGQAPSTLNGVCHILPTVRRTLIDQKITASQPESIYLSSSENISDYLFHAR